MHIQIDAPEVAEALNRLADALNAQTEVIRGCQPENEPKITLENPELWKDSATPAAPAEPAPAPGLPLNADGWGGEFFKKD